MIFLRMWQRYLSALKVNPYTTNIATGAIVTFFGDILAQKVETKYVESENNGLRDSSCLNKRRIDWERNVTVSTYWGLSAIPTYFWFLWLDKCFPINKISYRSICILGKKLSTHLCIFSPIMNACFYGWLILKARNSAGYENRQSSFRSSFWNEWKAKLKTDLLDTQKNSVMVWGAAQTFNFLFLLTHTRVLFNSVVSVFWTAYVSIVGHRKDVVTEGNMNCSMVKV